jgi:hypothetical protein
LRGDPPDASSLARKPTAAELRGQDLMRPAGRFTREREAVDATALLGAIDRRSEAVPAPELRELLDRRRGSSARR